MASFEDVDGDGRNDLVAHVSTQGLQLTDTATKAMLTATTFGGEKLRGTDYVTVVP